VKSCTQCNARFTGNPTRCPLDGAPLVELPDPLLGKVIGGRYRIEAKLGAGGMGSVYRASHDLLGRKVAIKFLAPELACDSVQRQRFLREARAANRIKHDNIIDIRDYGEDDTGLVYLVMELLEGESLAHCIARGPLPPRDALEVAIQIARALARAHELEVIHRDIKPENIFLVGRPGGGFNVKLLDFGLAHLRDEARLTASGAVFGTPEYMSPEQARGAPIKTGSDLYALGVVLFEMLTNHLPFEGSSAELIVKHLRTPPPAPSSRVASLPRELDDVVVRLMAKDAAARPRDANALIDELAPILAQYPDPAARKSATSAPRPAALPSEVGDDTEVIVAPQSQHPTPSPSSVRAWVERRTKLRAGIDAAYPRGGAPATLERAFAELDQLVERAVSADAEIQQVARALADRESVASDARDRIGRALDELTHDESAMLRQLDELERLGERARTRVEQAAAEFRAAWSEARASLPDDVLASVEAAAAVEAAARRATAWRQAVQEIHELDAQRASRTAAREDLRFQISQLKGRLGAMNADVEHDLSGLRARASELGGQLAQIEESLADTGATLSGHLLEHPQARAVISVPPPGRGPSADRAD
jgi:serine/threonine protein kinase